MDDECLVVIVVLVLVLGILAGLAEEWYVLVGTIIESSVL